MKRLRAFRTICGVTSVCLTFICFIPLASLAFEPVGTSQQAMLPQIAQEAVETNAIGSNKTNAEVYYLDETNTDPLKIDGKPVFDVYTVAERKERNLQTSLPKANYYYGDKTVYLTFDDGPDPDNTPQILSILRDANIKATFFVVGDQCEKYPEILKHIYQEGHAIGNHSYNHNYRQLYQTADTYIQQLQKTDDIIKNILGVRPRISRAPGGSAGSFTKEYWQKLDQQGYIEVGWNISSGDASSAKAEQLINNIATQMNNKFLWSHAIVLMHDGRGHEQTVKALPNIIQLFKERGFEFRVVNIETPPAW